MAADSSTAAPKDMASSAAAGTGSLVKMTQHRTRVRPNRAIMATELILPKLCRPIMIQTMMRPPMTRGQTQEAVCTTSAAAREPS